MCPQIIESFDQCVECEKEFKRMQISDPRKGYDVLQENGDTWTIQCKGCEETLVIQKH
jgi:hypothetical protein